MPWELAKSFDHSAVIGEFVPLQNQDIQNIDFSLNKNGTMVQKGNTSDMLFSVNEIICFVSQYMTLKTGDLIFTGTPEGVSKVTIGDRLEAFLGEQKLLDFMIK